MIKFAVTPPEDSQFSIMQRIIDGSLDMDSPEEFRDILKIYPDDPYLFRKFADLLCDKQLLEEAADAYASAAKCFIDCGMNLQSIVAKILQWSIQKPDHDQGRVFYALLHEEGNEQKPLQRFWARLKYAELVAVMRRLVRMRAAPGETIIHAGDPADSVFFVVSGCLAEMPAPDSPEKSGLMTPDPFLLGPNDVFGDIFPLDQPTTSLKEIRSLSHAELVKIAKPVLRDICRKYPRIELLLREIHKPEHRDDRDRAWQTVRRTLRYGLPTKVEIRCLQSESLQTDWVHTGIALDLSLGGICVDLGKRPFIDPKQQLKGRRVQIDVDLLNGVAILNLTGMVIWQKHQDSPDKTVLIGIRFDALNSIDKEMLGDYCAGSVGEQNLLWSLWETMIQNG